MPYSSGLFVAKPTFRNLVARTYADLDVNAGTILERKETIEEVGQRIFQDTLDVASGRKLTRAEQIGFHNEFKIWESLWPAL